MTGPAKFLLLLVAGSGLLVDAARLTLSNNCGRTVWPATITNGGSGLDGWELRPGQAMSVDRATGWSGRFWGRTGCSFDGAGNGRCATGDCNGLRCRVGGEPPATLAEFKIGGDGGKDFYDVSLVDGFNIPMSITRSGGTGSCKETSCKTNVNDRCPDELKVWHDNAVVACKSACLKFGNPEYCCSGDDHNVPATCPPTGYSMIFKQACPAAYSYAYDDLTSTFTCKDADYTITFCP